MARRARLPDLLPGRVDALAPDGDARGLALPPDAPPHPVRVRGGVPGDAGLLRILHRGQNATWVELAELHTPAPDRVEAPCPVVARCGGCPWQMVSRDAQRHARLDHLLAALGDLAATARVHPTVADPASTGYRTRALMMLGRVDGAPRLGFYAPRTDDLVPAESCHAQHPALNATLTAARDLLAPILRPHRGRPPAPLLVRALAMKLAPDDAGHAPGLLTLIACCDDPAFDRVAPALLALPHVAGVHLVVNDAPAGQLLRGPARHLAGARRLALDLAAAPDDPALSLLVGPTAFVQTHHAVARAMLSAARDLAPPRVAHLVDLYAGVGSFGLALRDRADAVTLVEINPDAIADARANAARLPDADHVTVVEADAADAAAAIVRGGPDELVILDPPRAGCAPSTLAPLAARHPATVLYASCNPRSLARDLAVLVGAGYALTDVVPLEMFPHTPHLEVLARLTWPASRPPP